MLYSSELSSIDHFLFVLIFHLSNIRSSVNSNCRVLVSYKTIDTDALIAFGLTVEVLRHIQHRNLNHCLTREYRLQCKLDI